MQHLVVVLCLWCLFCHTETGLGNKLYENVSTPEQSAFRSFGVFPLFSLHRFLFSLTSYPPTFTAQALAFEYLHHPSNWPPAYGTVFHLPPALCRGVLKIEAGIYWVNARYHHKPNSDNPLGAQQGPSKWENRTDARAQMATLAAAAKDAAGSVSPTKKEQHTQVHEWRAVAYRNTQLISRS